MRRRPCRNCCANCGWRRTANRRCAGPCASLNAPAASRARDRKSTRLNSSHSQISYAVFCLKKKKTPICVLHAGTALLATHAVPDEPVQSSFGQTNVAEHRHHEPPTPHITLQPAHCHTVSEY